MKLAVLSVALVGFIGIVAPAGAAPPTVVNFTFTPSAPQPGTQVRFTEAVQDDDVGGASSFAWDLDGDGGYDDAEGESVTREFATAGSKIVRMQVTDGESNVRTVQRTVTVSPPPNTAPVASFRHFPAAPKAGQVVDFVSVSYDPDGPLVAQEWDVDNDGQFDDASGGGVARAFPAGARTVRLRVRDSRGAVAVTSRTITVAAPLVAAAVPLSPFPVVRMVGRLTRTGTRVQRFTVQAPAGASVIVRCNGPKCPRRRLARTVTAKRIVRLRPFERRLRPGVVLQVFVSRPGSIGKYTRFGVRRRKAPSRRDRCLADGARSPTPCP